MLDWLTNRKERQKERELEREIQVKQTKKRIQRHIEQQREAEQRLWALGKRAIQLDDERQFRQIGEQVLWTREDIRRWERYLLSFETLEARRDQARLSGEFMESLHVLANSLLGGAGATSLADVQKNLEMGLARASDMEDRLDIFMDMIDTTFTRSGDPWQKDAAIDDMRSSMAGEARIDEAAGDPAARALDAQIEAGLKKLRAEMHK